VLVLDALGLGLFAVTGAQKAISYGINPVMAALLGMISRNWRRDDTIA
jgi:uncharacterized membrane protein YeiH